MKIQNPPWTMTNSSVPTRRWQTAIVMLLHLLSIAFILPLVLSNSENDVELNPLDIELMDAIRDENIEAASTALASGGNINAISPKGGQTPLMQSVLHGRTKMVEWCLNNGADVTIPERMGYTPMHGAGFQGRANIAALLLKHGVGLRDVHEDGHEPASEFSVNNVLRCIKHIIDSSDHSQILMFM
jgi:ankyrin repeat protein